MSDIALGIPRLDGQSSVAEDMTSAVSETDSHGPTTDMPLLHAVVAYLYDNAQVQDQLAAEGTSEEGPTYEEWGHNEDRTKSNNCYSYAVSDPNGGMREIGGTPGLAGGKAIEGGESPDAVASAAQADGLELAAGGTDELLAVAPPAPAAKEGHYIVALYMDMGEGNEGKDLWDHHWYRQDMDGTWSHKMGKKPPLQAKMAEDADKAAADQRNATDMSQVDTGSYKWNAYFYVPLEGIDTEGQLGKRVD